MFCIIKKLFFWCIYKISIISAEGYKNAGVDYLKIRETNELWVSMKNAGAGLGVKNIYEKKK